MTCRAAEGGESKKFCWVFLKTRRYLEKSSAAVSSLGKSGNAGSEMQFEGSRGEPKAVPRVCSTWVSPVCRCYVVFTAGAKRC